VSSSRELRSRIAVLMSDGRERTYSDMARDLNMSAPEGLRAIRKHSKIMQGMGLLTAEIVSEFAVVRAAEVGQ